MVSITGDTTVLNGSEIIFTGTITSSPPATSVTWQKVVCPEIENLAISDQKYSGSSVDVGSPKLVINDANFKDRATYQLEVKNLVGQTISNGIHLNVTGGI
jgi:hypothetical protein